MNARIVDELTCLVCADRAMGNNFGAISCESCKAFFRRNAHDIEKLRCEFTGKCTISILTRRHCRRCRLEKCFQVGMRKDWILTEEQLQIRRARIQSRKSRELATRPNINTLQTSSSSCNSTSQSSSSSSSSLPSSLPKYIISSSSTSSSCTNIKQLSSSDQHHHQTLHQQINHHTSHFADTMSFCLDPGQSSLNVSDIGLQEDENSNGQDEESDTDYAELCDKMGRKVFAHSFSHNMLTTLLDDSSHGQYSLPVESSFTSTNPPQSQHFYNEYEHSTSFQAASPVAPNVPSFLSHDSRSGHSLHHPTNYLKSSHHIHQSSILSSNPSSIPSTSSSSSSQIALCPSSSISHQIHLPDSMNPSFSNEIRTSSLTGNLFTSLPIKLEYSEADSDKTETIQRKVYDLIMGSDMSFPINICNEYITSDFALNQLLNQRINELKHPLYSMSNQRSPTDHEPTTLQEIFTQLIESIVKSLITSIKFLAPFNRLPLHVRNDMFKGSVSGLIMIRLCFLFDISKGGWPMPGSSKLIKYNFLKLDPQSSSYFLGFAKDLNERWTRDVKIDLILEAVKIFSYNTEDMKLQDDISKEKYVYTRLLRHYLESTGLSLGQARTDCYELLMRLETVLVNVKLLDRIRQICFQQPGKTSQLLTEIFDIS